MLAPREILVATDFGPASRNALRYGGEFVRAFGASLHVMHVVGDIVVGDTIAPSYLQEVSKAQTSMEAGAREELEAFVRDAQLEGRATLAVVTSNAVAAAILTYADEHPIDLVILGCHGHSGLAHLFLGSVAEKVVRAAPCPVLTVRESAREFVELPALESAVHV